MAIVRKKMYLNGSKDNNYYIANQIGIEEDSVAERNFAHALYEVGFDCEVDTETGNVKILEINADGAIFVPKN